MVHREGDTTMMPDNRLRHAERIERVLAQIEASDGEAGTLSLEALASTAALSPFHFHRVYRLMTGETLAETLRRVRLARTLPELEAEGQSITRAAAGAGYGSSQAFARAFRAATGGSASELRAGRTELIDRLLKPAPGGDGDVALEVEIVSTDPLRLLAIRNVGAYAELNLAYERLFEAVFSRNPMDALQGIYGVWHEDPRFTKPDALSFDCAIAVGDIVPPDGIDCLELAAGRHARLRHVGDYDSLHESIDRLYAIVIDQGLGGFADRPLFVNYVDDPSGRDAAELRSDIYLPLDQGH